MKVLVTGATGFLGHWMTRRLLDEGMEVRVLVRNRQKLEELSTISLGAIEVAEGDVTNYESLERACSGVQGVFHLAGLIAYSHAQRALMEEVNVQGTKNLIQAIQRTSQARLLHLSSVVAVGAGFSRDQILDETSEYNVGHLHLGYFDTKHDAEIAVFDAVKSGALEAIAVNPSTIYGPGDAKKGSRGVQLKVARGKFPFYPPGGVNIVHVDDVVDLSVKAFKSSINGERFIACGENLTIEETFRRIAKLANVAPPRFALPRSAIFALAKVGDALEKIDRKGPINSENAWTSTLFHWFKHDKATKVFGFKPRPAQEALEASINWSKQNGLI